MALVQIPAQNNSWYQITTGSMPASTSLNLTGLGSYNRYWLQLFGLSTTTANDTATIRFNADSGSNYNVFLVVTTATGTGNPTGTAVGTSAATLNMDFSSINAGASLFIESANTVGFKSFYGNRFSSTSAANSNGSFQGIWKNTAILTSIDITTGTNAFDAGTYVLFGSN